MTEWFRLWSGKEYLCHCPHRDGQDAASHATLISRHTYRYPDDSGAALDPASPRAFLFVVTS